MTVLFSHIVILFFKDYVVVSEFLQLVIEFSLFLLNSLVMHLIEVFIFQQFLVCAFCSFSYYDSLV